MEAERERIGRVRIVTVGDVEGVLSGLSVDLDRVLAARRVIHRAAPRGADRRPASAAGVRAAASRVVAAAAEGGSPRARIASGAAAGGKATTRAEHGAARARSSRRDGRPSPRRPCVASSASSAAVVRPGAGDRADEREGGESDPGAQRERRACHGLRRMAEPRPAPGGTKSSPRKHWKFLVIS